MHEPRWTYGQWILCAALIAALMYPLSSRSAINPSDPGLADAQSYGRKAISNNGASSLCVECHTENPTIGYGTHYVLNMMTGELRLTRSGGGWDDSYWGPREEGQFLKILPWDGELGGSGGSSKYGDTDTWESVVYADPGITTIAIESSRNETATQNFIFYELICESCHNIRANVIGGYHLLSRVLNNPEVVGERIEGSTADLCVGCHGFLYHDDEGVSNSAHLNWDDPRNFSDITGDRRGNNERHFIVGTEYPRNHHVMTGDAIVPEVANAGLLLRDVAALSDDSISNPIRTDADVGAMPLRTVPNEPIKVPTNREFLHCVTCHAPGHGGDLSLGASLLRGEQLGGKDSGSGIDRIADGRGWNNFQDHRFCMLCHIIRGEKQ